MALLPLQLPLQLPGMPCGATRTCSRKRQIRGADTPDDAVSGGYCIAGGQLKRCRFRACMWSERERIAPAMKLLVGVVKSDAVLPQALVMLDFCASVMPD